MATSPFKQFEITGMSHSSCITGKLTESAPPPPISNPSKGFSRWFTQCKNAALPDFERNTSCLKDFHFIFFFLALVLRRHTRLPFLIKLLARSHHFLVPANSL